MAVQTRNKMKSKAQLFISGLIILSFTSCISYDKIRYFTDIDDITEPIANPKQDKVISPFDNLYIQVLSIDAQTASILNLSEGGESTMPVSLVGYTVDVQGNINYPFVGEINVGGLTLEQASEKIKHSLSQYINNASIIVKFLDNRVSVLGEVENQGIYPFSQDKLNVYEALALGGGLTEYADRKNVILIRQEGDQILHYKLDVSNSRIASKEYYYILSNDILLVEPLKEKTRTYSRFDFLTVVMTVNTLLTTFLLFMGL